MNQGNIEKITYPDELVIKQGEHHVGKLTNLLNKIKEQFSDEKIEKLFDIKTDAELEKFVNEHPELEKQLDKLLTTLTTIESTKAPGHDFSHIVDNLNSALRIFTEYTDIRESEKLEVILACLFHDLGRFAEPFLKEAVDKKDLGILLPALVGRMFERKIGQLPEELSLRILFDIWSGSMPATEFRTADIVHQCDREQLIGSATIYRGLAFDVGVDKRELAVPLNEKFRNKLPMPETQDDRYWLVQYEFFMRNLYSPTSPDGQRVANRNKLENAVILMLAINGQSQEYYNQVFGPELGLVKQGEPEVHWSKKPIPMEVFEEAKKEKDDFLLWLEQANLEFKNDISWLSDFAYRVIATDKTTLPENMKAILLEKLESCSENERKNIWTILIYTLKKRHEKRIDDLEFLKDLEKQKGFSAVVAKNVIFELQSREVEFAKSNILAVS